MTERKKAERKGTLYLIPNLLADTQAGAVLSGTTIEVVRRLKYFIVEKPKPARALLKKSGVPTPFKGITFLVLNKQTPLDEKEDLVKPLFEGHDMGIVSDAGYPVIQICIAHSLKYGSKSWKNLKKNWKVLAIHRYSLKRHTAMMPC